MSITKTPWVRYNKDNKDYRKGDLMNTRKMEIEVPEALLSYIDCSDKEYHKKIKELMVYQLVKEGKISFGKAAEILEMDKVSYIMDLGKIGIPYYDCDIDEVHEDSQSITKYLGEDK